MPRTQQRNRASVALLLIASLLAACGPSTKDATLPPPPEEMLLIGGSAMSSQTIGAVLDMYSELIRTFNKDYPYMKSNLFALDSPEAFTSTSEYYGVALEQQGFERMTGLHDIVVEQARGADEVYIAGWAKRKQIFIMYAITPFGENETKLGASLLTNYPDPKRNLFMRPDFYVPPE